MSKCGASYDKAGKLKCDLAKGHGGKHSSASGGGLWK